MGCTSVEETIVQTILLADEKFDSLWFDPIASPVRWQGNVIGELLVVFLNCLLKDRLVSNLSTLR